MTSKAIVLWAPKRPRPVIERMYVCVKQTGEDGARCWVITITQRKRQSPEKDVFDLIATDMLTGATVPVLYPYVFRTLNLARKDGARMARDTAMIWDPVEWKDGAIIVGPSHGGSLR